MHSSGESQKVSSQRLPEQCVRARRYACSSTVGVYTAVTTAAPQNRTQHRPYHAGICLLADSEEGCSNGVLLHPIPLEESGTASSARTHHVAGACRGEDSAPTLVHPHRASHNLAFSFYTIWVRLCAAPLEGRASPAATVSHPHTLGILGWSGPLQPPA